MFAFQAGPGTDSFNSDVYFARYDATGNHLATTLVLDIDGSFETVYGLAWTGRELVLMYRAGGEFRLQRAMPDGTLLGSYVVLPGGGFMAWNGSRLGAVYKRGDTASGWGLYFRVYDATLAPVESEVEIVPPTSANEALVSLGGQGLIYTGRRWVVGYSDKAATTAHLAVLSDRALESTRAIARAGGQTADQSEPTLAGGEDGALVCWKRIHGMWDFEYWCGRVDGLGMPTGAPSQLTPRLSTMGGAVGISRWGAGYVIIFVSTTPGQSDSFVWRDADAAFEMLARPADMDGSEWGFSYWESDFGVLDTGPELIMQGRGDRVTGDATRHGYTFSRVRLRCAP